MPSITFTAHYGDKTKQVNLSQPSGAGDMYHIMIDNYYYGQMVFAMGDWHCYLQNKGSLSADDQQVLCEILRENHVW